MIAPYWQSDDGAIVVYHARCEDVLAAGLVPVRDVALVHADPPYGVKMQADRTATRGGISHPRRAFAPVVWDKRVAMPSDDGSDCELAWSNIGASGRMFRHVWKGLCRDSEQFKVHLHPTQKPIALSAYVFARAKLKPGQIVLVPYLGSGPDLPAARAAGLRVIACEVERAYCDTAIARLGAVTPERAAQPAGPLFAPRSL